MTSQKTPNPPRLRYWGAVMYLAFPFISVYYGARMLFSSKYRRGLRQRLTMYTQEERDALQSGNVIWIHTVSVGELNAARALIEHLKTHFPHYKILVSTVTETGQTRAKEIDAIDYSIYLPLDLYALCFKSLRLVNPALLIIFETELWPNFLRAAYRWGVPTYLVNARLSDKSFRGYKLFRRAFAPLLKQMNGIMAQSQQDQARFIELGVRVELVQNAGNIKFDSAPEPDDGTLRQHWRGLFHIKPDELLIVAGSTFEGEELMLCEAFKALLNKISNLRLLLAPRHVTRIEQIESTLLSHGFQYQRRSRLSATQTITPETIFLLDTTGELSQVYAAADIVYIGKSLVQEYTGGQNPIEPAAWGKPVVFGPNMHNFRDVAAQFLRNEAAIQVQNHHQLQTTLQELASSSTMREELGQKAQHVVKNNQGALNTIIKTISPQLGCKQSI